MFQDNAAQAAELAGRRLHSDLSEACRATGEWANAPLAELLVAAALDRCMDVLACTGLWGEGNRAVSNLVWTPSAGLMEAGRLQWRARFKPHGYAGDFEMLAQIGQYWTTADGLGRPLDLYFQRQTAPEAVRSRMRAAAAILTEASMTVDRPLRVVAYGAGPALEIEWAIAAQADRAWSVRLLDLDPAALEYARVRLAALGPQVQVVGVRENLFRLPRRGDGQEVVGESDVAICLGLLDYLDPAATAETLGLLWNSVAPGGRLLAAHFALPNPSRAYMEWIGNWYLVYRTEDELLDAAHRAGIPPALARVTRDTTGTAILLHAVKS